MNAYARTLEATQKALDKLHAAEARVVALEAENASLRAAVARHEALFRDSGTLQALITATCEHFDIPKTMLLGPCRVYQVARARQIIMFLARQMTPLSTAVIGRHLGNRDHTTIIHGSRLIARLVDNGGPITEAVDAIQYRVEARCR